MESNHLNKTAHRSKRGKKKKTTVKAMINTRNSKKGKHEDVKKGLKNHKMWGRKVGKSRLF